MTMIRVQFRKFSQPDETPTWLDGSVRAVPAEPFDDVDEGQGGITLGDIVDPAMIAQLDSFAVGSEVYVESEDVTDCLDDTDEATERETHIWWLATVMPVEVSE
jgi:hypothetical protein